MAISLRQRFQTSFDILLHGLPYERKQAAGRFPLVWPSFRQGIPQWQLVDFSSYVAEGFNLNTLIYSAIMYKVRALRSAPLRAYTGDVDQPERLPADDPLAMLVARPNQQQSWMAFHGQNIVYLNISGNTYIWMIRTTAKGLPEQMYSLRPDRVYILPAPDKKTIIGYLYVPEGASAWAAWSTDQRVAALNSGGVTPILPQDMAHVKLPNPDDPLDGMGYGLSPLAPLGQSADVDNNVTRFLKKFFDQGTMVTGLLSFDVPMQTSDVSAARERWKEIYGGVDNWDIAVLDQGGKYQRVGMTFDEMGFETIDDRNESRILGPLGVPGILIGTRLGLNRAINANAKELRAMCWQDTLLPENALFEDELQYFLQTESGGFVAFDYSKVEALKKDVVALVDAHTKLWATGVPANMAARTVGLSIEDIPGGDMGYLPLNVVPVSSSAGKPDVTQQGAPEAVAQAQQGKAMMIIDEHKAVELANMRLDFGMALSDFRAAMVSESMQIKAVTLNDGQPNTVVNINSSGNGDPKTIQINPVSEEIETKLNAIENALGRPQIDREVIREFSEAIQQGMQFKSEELTRLFDNIMEALANLPAPVAKVEINVPEQSVNVDVNVPAQPVTLTMQGTTSVVRRDADGRIAEIESEPRADIVPGG
jgi:HK97 family phage portal protein